MLAIAKVALQLATSDRYGIFRDELYYIACADHLSWGYVGHPPLIAFVTWFSTHVFGTSLFGIRFLPAIAGGLLVYLTAAIAKALGGNRFAQCIAAFSIIPVPSYLMLNHWLTMNAFEPLLWTSALWLSARMLSRSEPRYWLLSGVLCG
jgi:4-amino-4-deoxy-L-arabinose transferase-like glycosyltransferase